MSKVNSRPTEWQWSCGLCKQDHALKTCRKFLNASADERYDVAIMQGYCINCLARSHRVENCRNEYGCRVCTKRHNTLVHDAPQLRTQKDKTHKKTKDQQTQTTQANQFSWPNVFSPTVTVQVARDEKSKETHHIRAMLNQSATVTTIARSIVKRLGLRQTKRNGHELAIVNIRGRNKKILFSRSVTALITDRLPRRPYTDPIKPDPTEDFTEDTLADIDPRANTPLEMELGGDIYPYLRRDGAIELDIGRVVAHKTALGYVFVGPADKPY